MEQVYFLFVVMRLATEVEVYTIDLPFNDPDECVRVASIVYDRVKPKHSAIRGVLCWTLDEVSTMPKMATVRRNEHGVVGDVEKEDPVPRPGARRVQRGRADHRGGQADDARSAASVRHQ